MYYLLNLISWNAKLSWWSNQVCQVDLQSVGNGKQGKKYTSRGNTKKTHEPPSILLQYFGSSVYHFYLVWLKSALKCTGYAMEAAVSHLLQRNCSFPCSEIPFTNGEKFIRTRALHRTHCLPAHFFPLAWICKILKLLVGLAFSIGHTPRYSIRSSPIYSNFQITTFRAKNVYLVSGMGHTMNKLTNKYKKCRI